MCPLYVKLCRFCFWFSFYDPELICINTSFVTLQNVAGLISKKKIQIPLISLISKVLSKICKEKLANKILDM